MCVKLPPGDLNLLPYPPHLTNTYTCRVTAALKKMHGAWLLAIRFHLFINWEWEVSKLVYSTLQRYIYIYIYIYFKGPH